MLKANRLLKQMPAGIDQRPMAFAIVGQNLYNGPTFAAKIAFVKMKCLFLLLWAVASIGHARDWFVSTNGTGNGSITNPWALQVALTNDTVIQAGDTIWMRGGAYSPVITNGINSNHEIDINGNPVGLHFWPNILDQSLTLIAIVPRLIITYEPSLSKMLCVSGLHWIFPAK